ncbi:unnamed protein product [Candida verbasci]|uniref:Cyclin-like domain-containing protein n=1 Tax=Candida verbasci TaxID=1227364 RepID=A0A9W4XBY8_9ASCO|nr:unnamed protein product [Candida verbasci]
MLVKTPDPFVSIREYQSSLKASNLNLQQMEFKNHATTINSYSFEILYHQLYVESKALPNLSLIQQQPEIKMSMRPMLLDFLMEVITILNLSRSTFPLTVNLIDRYCSTRIVKKQHYQLLGLTSLWIAAKNLDQKCKIPTLQDLKKICLDSYYKDLFIEMEKHILKSLEWNVNSPTVDFFIDIYMNYLSSFELITKNYQRIKLFSNYIVELFQFYPNVYFDYTSSQIALISILSTILILKIPINILNLLSYMNELIKSKQFQSNIIEEFQIDEILNISTFQNLLNKSFFKNLLKMIESPPKSLEIKYFSNSSKFNKLMKQLVILATESLLILQEPIKEQVITRTTSTTTTTPKYKMVGIPLTPISNSTSPKREINSNMIAKGDVGVGVGVGAGLVTPESRTSPGNPVGVGRKRSFECIEEIEICQSLINQQNNVGINGDFELKRSKSTTNTSSTNNMFYIPY